MGNTPAQKRQKQLRGKKRRKGKKPDDPRTSSNTGGPIKITKADGTVENIPGRPGWKNVGKTNYFGNPYSKARPRKY